MALLISARFLRQFAAIVLALGLLPNLRAQAASLPEYQIKAVFLFNFTLFTQWPATAFSAPDAPLIIGVLGEDPFGAHLDDAVRGETVNQRPVVVRRSRRVEDMLSCHVLFVSQSESPRFSRILTAVQGRSILTVSDVEGFATRGGMIRFMKEGSKIRLRVNVESARAAGLTLSSKLLRPAEIVGTGKN